MALLLERWGPVLRGVEVVPGTGGIFDVHVDGDLVFTKKMLGRYPDRGTSSRCCAIGSGRPSCRRGGTPGRPANRDV